MKLDECRDFVNVNVSETALHGGRRQIIGIRYSISLSDCICIHVVGELPRNIHVLLNMHMGLKECCVLNTCKYISIHASFSHSYRLLRVNA